MRIDRIKMKDFRIYSGENEVLFNNKKGKNISLIAGKNGFGKTTFLTSLIWSLYGNLMSQVESKYKNDIIRSGGYEKFVKSLLNKNALIEFESNENKQAEFYVELHFVDVMIPSIPCKRVIVKRSYNFKTKKESLKILIDGQENKLTKEVGYDVFINDFILPREIAKFFFFDAEKIVTLAEARSNSELRSLSKAYSEVLGIKKYEDLKLNLNALLTKLRRSGVSKLNKSKLEELIEKDNQFSKLIELNETNQSEIDEEITLYKSRLDGNQEKLIREGNAMTQEELLELKKRRDELQKNLETAKNELKKLMDIVPLVVAGPRLKELVDQVKKEMVLKNSSLNKDALAHEFEIFETEFNAEISKLVPSKDVLLVIKKQLTKLVETRLGRLNNISSEDILLDFDDETARSIISIYKYIQDSFSTHFKGIVKNEKETRQELGRIKKKIKEGEARKDNPLAQKLREYKFELDEKVNTLLLKKHNLIECLGGLRINHASNNKVLSEYEKYFKLVEMDKKKYDVTTELLKKLNVLTLRIKDEKKFSLQKSILIHMNKLMHKDQFITNVQVYIKEDIMDIELIDSKGNIIDKDSLSKGEQQLYATALLKALVDESGINFPVFIDSPLQKFDKEHSSNVIEQFYPTISDQVVLFPLLEKELSKIEYDQLKPNLNGVYLINNNSKGSSIIGCKIDELFTKFKEQNYNYAH